MSARVWIGIGTGFTLLLMTSIGLTACGNRSPETASLNVVIPGFALPDEDRLYSVSSLASINAISSPLLPPEDITGFKCIAVNIMGPGIPDTDSNPERSTAAVLADFGKKNFCSYAGKFSAIVERSAFGNTLTIEDAPIGENRVIELLGIQVPSGQPCPTSVHQDEGDALYFHLGHKVTNITAGDNEVPIDNQYATTYPRVFSLASCGNVPLGLTTTGTGTCSDPGLLAPAGSYRYYQFNVAEAASNIPLTKIKIMSITPKFLAFSGLSQATLDTGTTPACTPVTTSLGNSGQVMCRFKYINNNSSTNALVPYQYELVVRVYEHIEVSGGQFSPTANYFETTLQLDATCP